MDPTPRLCGCLKLPCCLYNCLCKCAMCEKAKAKVVLVIFNGIFFLLGAGCLALGIFVLAEKSPLISVLGNVPSAQETVEDVISQTSILKGSAYALIGAGTIVFIIGFCGCCGAIKESKCMLYIYALFIFVILAVQIAAAVLAFFFKDRVDEHLQGYLEDTIVDYYTGATFQADGTLGESIEPVSAAWDFTMAYFECCGNQDYLDFYNYATKWNKTYIIKEGDSSKTIKAKVPVTCCKMEDPSVFPGDLEKVVFLNLDECLTKGTVEYTHRQPCYEKMEEVLSNYSIYVIGVALVVAGLEILLIASACVLAKKVDTGKTYAA